MATIQRSSDTEKVTYTLTVDTVDVTVEVRKDTEALRYTLMIERQVTDPNYETWEDFAAGIEAGNTIEDI